MKNQYECTLSFIYDAENPVDAVNQFMANIEANPNWWVAVKDISTKEQYIVDSETGDIESI
jgi:hypothetical protein